MKVRQLEWVKTYDNTINKGSIHLEDWRSDGKHGQNYHVGSTVGGKVFYSVPRLWEEAYTHQWHVSSSRKECSSIEEGKHLCQEHWENFVKELICE